MIVARRYLNGFSLVELSIVLVILGLLVGGILAGKSLIRASELRAVTRERDQITTAIHTFKDKYLYRPGDLPNATQFWPPQGDCGAGNVPTDACNGNGNGYIDVYGTAASEQAMSWLHLSKAGLITGQYYNYNGSSCTDSAAILAGYLLCYPSRVGGTNIEWNQPDRSSIIGGNYLGMKATPPDYTNSLVIGYHTNTGVRLLPYVMTAAEAANIDTKIDDGKPATGKVVVWSKSTSFPYFCSTAASSTDLTGVYSLGEDSDKSCSLIFLAQ